MAKVILISCSKKKQSHKAEASKLYTSPLFQKSLTYAHQLSPDKIFILSAKYHVLGLHETIEPYDITLNKMRIKEIKIWAHEVIQQLHKKTDVENDLFIFLTGRTYCNYLLPHLKHYKTPLDGLNLGNRLRFLNEHNVS